MRAQLALLLTVLVCLHAHAQSPEDIRELLSRYRKERAAAALFDPGAPTLVTADGIATRAEAALKNDKTRLASRLVREARWALPALPAGLPEHVTRVIGYTRLRHADRINALAYSPDGQLLASASRDGKLRVWDMGNGSERFFYAEFPDDTALSESRPENDNVLKVADVAFSPVHASLAVVSGNEIHIVDTKTGKRIRVLRGPKKSLQSIAFSPDGKTLASGGNDNIVRIWDVETGKETRAFTPQPTRIESVAYAPNGKLIAAVDDDGNLFFYSSEGTSKTSLANTKATDGPTQTIRSVTFLPDSSKVFTAGSDKSPPRLISVPGATNSLTTLQKFPGHTDTVTAVASVAGGKLLVTASDDRTVRVWEITSGKAIRQFQGHLGKISAIAVRPDGQQLASAGEDGSIRIWDLSATDEHTAFTEATDSIWSTAISPDGSRFATAGADRIVRVYDSASNMLIHSFKDNQAAVTSVVFLSSDQLASAGGDKLIRIWDLKSGRLQHSLQGHTSAVLALAVGNGMLVSGSADRTVKVWDSSTAKVEATWTGRSTVTALSIRPSKDLIAVGTADGGLTLLSKVGAELKPLSSTTAHSFGVSATSFHPDGSMLATTGGDGAVKVWPISLDGTLSTTPRLFETGVKPTQAGATTALSTVAFSHDGRQLAAAGVDSDIHIWNTTTSLEIRTIRGSTDWVTSMQFGPKSRTLLTAGVDRVARLFELTQTESTTRIGHAMAARALCVSRDGKYLATASDDKTIKLWNITTGEELSTLTGPVDSTFSLVFTGPNQIVAGGQDGRLRWLQFNPNSTIHTSNTGTIYTIIPSPDRKRIGVWSRNASSQDTFEIYTVEGPTGESYSPKDRELTCGTFSPDLTMTATGDKDGKVRIWDIKKKERVGADWQLFEQQAIGDLAFSADQKMLIAVSGNGEFKIADIATRKVMATAKASLNGINGIFLSPKGARVAVLGADGDVRLYDLEGKELRRWLLPSTANSATFAPDGTQLITANADGTAYVLSLPVVRVANVP